MTPTYLDDNATTPLEPAGVVAMLSYLRNYFGTLSAASGNYRRPPNRAFNASFR